jgi:hypothetical protein
MNWAAWSEIEKILYDHEIRPILAVVPDNRDEELEVGPVNESFWGCVRRWDAQGWTIAMHGWQHRFVTTDAGVLGVNKRSEFAGLPRPQQEEKIRSGREVLLREQVNSTVWIAPAHSFDAVTIQILKEQGFRYISDGFVLFPYVDKYGMTWIPQQLWSFRRRPFGVWTICFHPNSWGSREIREFGEQVSKYRTMISDFNAVVKRYGARKKTIIDFVAAETYRSMASVNDVVKYCARPFQRKNLAA